MNPRKRTVYLFDVLVSQILKYLCDRNRVIYKGLDKLIQYIDMAISWLNYEGLVIYVCFPPSFLFLPSIAAFCLLQGETCPEDPRYALTTTRSIAPPSSRCIFIPLELDNVWKLEVILVPRWKNKPKRSYIWKE